MNVGSDAHFLARSVIYDLFGQRVWLIDPPVGVCNQYSSINTVFPPQKEIKSPSFWLFFFIHIIYRAVLVVLALSNIFSFDCCTTLVSFFFLFYFFMLPYFLFGFFLSRVHILIAPSIQICILIVSSAQFLFPSGL